MRALGAACAAAGVEVRAIVEVNVGMNRAGLPWIDESSADGSPVVALARLIQEVDGLRFVGIMGYEGHAL